MSYIICDSTIRNIQRTCNAKISSKRERERESSLRLICHTERSEVSKNANANVQNPLDISVSAKPQYDKANAGQYNKVDSIASERNPISSTSLAGGDSIYSPSRSTSGARGWVDTTSALQAKPTTTSEYGIFILHILKPKNSVKLASKMFDFLEIDTKFDTKTMPNIKRLRKKRV